MVRFGIPKTMFGPRAKRTEHGTVPRVPYVRGDRKGEGKATANVTMELCVILIRNVDLVMGGRTGGGFGRRYERI